MGQARHNHVQYQLPHLQNTPSPRAQISKKDLTSQNFIRCKPSNHPPIGSFHINPPPDVIFSYHQIFVSFKVEDVRWTRQALIFIPRGPPIPAGAHLEAELGLSLHTH